MPDYGIDPLIGVDVFTTQSIVVPFGESLVWEVIPFDYFYTRETQPQVIVSVDGMPALCTGFQCGYQYIDGTALITGFELTTATELRIDGANLNAPTRVEFA